MTSQPTQTDFLQLTSSAEASPARTSAWLDAVLDWQESGQPCSLSSPGSSALLALAGVLSKTCPDSSVLTADGISESSSIRWGSSGIGGPTGSLTLSTSEWPSDAVVCTLSDILEARVPPKYYLSPKACAGILRRAERRGRKLPELLEAALRMTSTDTEPTSPIPCTPAARSTTTGRSTPTYSVRRLTPTECERLQGFPDGWTTLPTPRDTPPSATP